MTGPFRFRQGRAILGLLLVAGLFIAVMDIAAILYQREAVLEQARIQTRNELNSFGHMLEAPLLLNQLSSVSEILTKWAEDDNDLISLRAVTPNGFELVRIDRQRGKGTTYRETRDVSVGGRRLLTIEVEEIVEKSAEEALAAAAKIMAASVGSMGLLVLALWLTVRRTAVIPLENEIARREAAEKDLEAAQQALEEKIRARTEELSQATQRLLTHTRQTPLAYIEWDEGFRVAEWNPSAERIFGHPRGEVLGRNALDMIVPPESLAQVKETWKNLLEAGGFRNTSDNITSDGRKIVCEWYNTPLKDETDRVIGFSSLAQDVTDRISAAKALARSEEKFRELFNSSGDAIFILDFDGLILEVNQTVCDRYGYPAAELKGKAFSELGTPAQARFAPIRLERLRKSLLSVYETEHVTKSGKILSTEVTARRIEIEGKPVILLSCRDISERRRAEEEQRAIERQMQQAQKLESLGILAGGIAHDFNNILTAILGNADIALLRMSPYSPGRANVESIENAAHRAADLAKQMLAYSGRGQFVIQAVDLGAIVREMTHLLEVSIPKKALLSYELAEELPAIEADSTQLRQVVMNLVINAAEALGEEGGVVSLRTGKMECDRRYLDETASERGLPEGAYVYLEVSDTGCGMDRETLSRIFDPFFTTKFTGRGLGLAAVLGILRGHRGAIKVYSEPGRGTTFKLLFPKSAAVVEKSGGAEARAEWRAQGTMLLVDDEETVREIGKQMIEVLGFKVLLARDGVEAIEVFSERAEEISLVLLDLTMPRMDGVETFRELRRIDPDVKVILCSGYSEQDATRRFTGKGISGFIQKPYKVKDLMKEVRSVLEKSFDPA